MKRIALFIALALLVPATAMADQGKTGKVTQPAVDSLIAAAKAQGKPLVIDFYTTWCKPCKKFDAEVLSRKDVRTALGDVIFQKYNAEKGNGLKAAQRYAVRSYPTFLAIDGKGVARSRRRGSIPAASFIEFVRQARVSVLDAHGVHKLLAAKAKDGRALLAVARWYRARGKWKQADAIYRRAVKADPGDALRVAGVAAWECMQLQRYHRARAWIVSSNVSFIKRFPTSSSALGAFSQVAPALPKAERDALAASMLPGMMVEAARLNSAVYIFLAADTLDAALIAAKQQVKLLPKRANPYDTLAEAHHYRGDTANAVAMSNKAISLAKPNEIAELRRNLKRFQAPGKRPSPGVARAVYRAKQFLAKLPGIDPFAQKLTRRGQTGGSALMAFFTSARSSFSAIGKVCAKRAGKLPEIYVRIEFANGSAKKAKRIVVLEPHAPWRLKRCLIKNLSKVKWAERPSHYKTRYTSAVHFPKKRIAPRSLKRIKPRKPAK